MTAPTPAADPAPFSPAGADPTTPAAAVAFGPFVLDAAEQRLTRDGEPLALSGRPLQVLALLAARAGRLVDKDAVLDGVWGHRHVTDSVLKGAVNTLRAALGDDAKAPRYIETVPRRGYRFIAPLRPLPAPAAASATPTALPGAEAGPPSAQAAWPGAADTAGKGTGTAGLIGREAEALQLRGLLAGHRLVTLTGLGGIGKTRLALAVAGDAPPPDGVALVRLESLADGDPLASTVAQALALGPGAGASAAALARALAPLRLRLVLDNAEHVVDAVAALVATLLDGAPLLQVLVTSQVPLHLAGERVLPLAALALPDDFGDAAPDPAGYAAARLFCERVRERQPGWQPQRADAAGIAAICRALDGVPLALELAAARVPLLGVAGVQARLDQRFTLLTRAPRDAATRHRTLAAALDWTCGLLDAAEQRALQTLALVHGRFDVEAAESLLDADDALDLVDALRERSLIVVEPDGGLRLFDSVRRHALQALAAGNAGAAGFNEAAAHQRHLAWLRTRFEASEAVEFCTPLLQWLPPLAERVDDLRAALRFGLVAEAADPAVRDGALRLLAASLMFWARSGLRAEGLRWLELGRAAAPAAGWTRTLLDLGHGLFVTFAQLGAPADALAALRAARPALQQAGETRREYLSLYAERMLLMRLAPQDEVAPLLARMRELQQPDWGPLARRYLQMLEAFAWRDRGDFARYESTSRAMAAACRAAGGRAEVWAVENALTQALALQGRLDEACALIARTADDVRAAGRQREQVQVLAIAAMLHLRRDAGAATLALAHEAVRLLRADGMLWWMADALPWAAWHAGRAHDAARLQAWADAVAKARGDTRGPLFSRLRGALVDALAGHAEAAPLQALLQQDPGLDDDAALALAFGVPG
ncbi:ATP-binding protein [Aquabacterium humicola]|uniref:ATP-binding protein n=1 Tax=Aquabacterium humicola TaxID=3237377 RepID=UPI002542DB14|nr:winged helix-turn-helix domain-containing protein [Rubrivivax pictus]